MKELSIFIDESGDFGEYNSHSQYYIITLVLHDQSVDISENIQKFRETIKNHNMPEYIVHSGPLIRREGEFRNLDFADRKRVFDCLFHFVRRTDITYHTIIIEKKHCTDEKGLDSLITKQLSQFLNYNIGILMTYERIVIYYDYGQFELTKILLKVFNRTLSNVDFRKVKPKDYKLFQAADMFCTLELLSLKRDTNTLSKSETSFFKSGKELYKSYLKKIQNKRFSH
jgi:hypothetical protein